MKTVVTGGAGFIGSHLTESLIALGHQVLVLDNLSTGRVENLASLKDDSQLTFRNVDVSISDDLAPFFDQVDWVFHLAALADIVPSIKRPLSYHAANVEGTIRVLEAARKADVKRFVYAASSSCYGIPDAIPTPETSAMHPMYPYALTKYVGEQYALHWAQVYKLPVISLRLFNVFGPRARTTGAYGAVFGVFLAQKLAGQPLTVVGDGTQTRDFTYVADVVDAMVSAAGSHLIGEVFNVGSGTTHTINELASLLGGDVVHLPKRPGEPDSTYADISKIRDLLGWSPKFGFQEGVEVMVSNLDDWRDAPVWDSRSIAAATADWFKFLSP